MGEITIKAIAETHKYNWQTKEMSYFDFVEQSVFREKIGGVEGWQSVSLFDEILFYLYECILYQMQFIILIIDFIF